MQRVDLNSDLGESFGRYKLGLDEEVMKYITSANVACGWHAGDPMVMRKTVKLAKELNVAVGAHPGYPDLLGFGRRYMDITREEARNYVL
ncbi:LamB/YcsF family protein, partial [Thermococcus sibiricus]